MTSIDTVIVGAGQAGLGLSYFLQRQGRRHVIFERGRIGESWLSQRWDSFKLNTLNFMNGLPGLPYRGPEPDGFWTRDELVSYFQRYVEQFRLPVRTGLTVTSIEQADDRGQFTLKTRNDQQVEETVVARSVIIASGMQNTPKYPAIRSRLPAEITQLHTAEYRNAEALPPGAVVIVGSGQSGCQIAEDLLSAGRRVYVCTSKVGRAPRRYRGRDLLEWWKDMQFWELPYASLKDKSVSRAAQPHISGLGRHGHTLSLQQMARQGAVILGRLLDVEGSRLLLGDEAGAHVRFADMFSQQKKAEVDAYLLQAGITPPPLEDDPADVPDPQVECASPLRRLDLQQARVGSIIWSTGFTGDFSWMHLPTFDAQGNPLHRQGSAPVRGLYFLGFPWLVSRKSGILYGIEDDAARIAGAVAKQLD